MGKGMARSIVGRPRFSIVGFKQYVWDVRYIDAPAVRFRDGNTDRHLRLALGAYKHGVRLKAKPVCVCCAGPPA